MLPTRRVWIFNDKELYTEKIGKMGNFTLHIFNLNKYK